MLNIYFEKIVCFMGNNKREKNIQNKQAFLNILICSYR